MVGCGVSAYTSYTLRVYLTTVTVCETARPVTATNISLTGLVCEVRDRHRSGDNTMVRIEIDLLYLDGPI